MRCERWARAVSGWLTIVLGASCGQITNDSAEPAAARAGGAHSGGAMTGGLPASRGEGGPAGSPASGGQLATGGSQDSGGTSSGGVSSGGIPSSGGSAQGGNGVADCSSRTEAACRSDCVPVYGKPAGCLLTDRIYAGCVPADGVCVDSPGCGYPAGHPEQCVYTGCLYVADTWTSDYTCDTPECVHCTTNPRPESDWSSDSCPETTPATTAALPEGYAIDRTEVTRAEYQTWLSTGPSTLDQIPDCSWNASFAPEYSCMTRQQVSHDAEYCRHPQVCVDWCDAYAYCRAIGRRLCGNIGGGPLLFEDYANAALSQWYNACSSHAANQYPYGSSYDANTCNGYEYSGVPHFTRAVGTLPGCQSEVAGYEGVYDLSGNVWEWQDSCQSGTGVTFCRLGGGSFYGSASNLTCAVDSYEYRQITSQSIGFRCCSSP